MDVIYIKRDETDNLINFSNIRKISTPLIYDKAYDIDKYSRLELSVYLMYQDGMLLVRNKRLRDTPGIIPSTEVCVPPMLDKSDIFDSEQMFRNVLEWNIVYAVSKINSYGYEIALNYGFVSVSDMLHNTLSISSSRTKYYEESAGFEGEWIRVNAYIDVSNIADPNKCAYVDYKSFKRYYNYKQKYGEEFYGYREDMGKYSPIYSNADHRICKSDEIWSAFEARRYAK